MDQKIMVINSTSKYWTHGEYHGVHTTALLSDVQMLNEALEKGYEVFDKIPLNDSLIVFLRPKSE